MKLNNLPPTNTLPQASKADTLVSASNSNDLISKQSSNTLGLLLFLLIYKTRSSQLL